MSQPNLQAETQEEEVVVVKPRFNVYTMMLLLSLFAIITACILLYLEMDSYRPEGGDRSPWDTQGVTVNTLSSLETTSLA